MRRRLETFPRERQSTLINPHLPSALDQSRLTFGLRVDEESRSSLIPTSGRGACLVEHLRQLLALLLGGPFTCNAMLVRPLVRFCVPGREHLVVVAGDLGYRDRRCPAHAPATLANLIWSLHLNTSLNSSSPSARDRHPQQALEPDASVESGDGISGVVLCTRYGGRQSSLGLRVRDWLGECF